MGELFGRRALVTMGVPGSAAVTIDSGLSPARGFHVAFSVAKSLKSTLNQATVRMWNLEASNRERVRAERARFQVEAGYGEEIYVLFRGQITHGEPAAREGPDLVTQVECMDGVDAVQQAEAAPDVAPGGGSEARQKRAATFRRGGSIGDLVKRLADRFAEYGVVVGDTAGVLAKLERRALARGYKWVTSRDWVLDGRAADLLDVLGRGFRFDWSLQNGIFEIHPWDDLASAETLDVSAATGLIGTPSRIVAAARKVGQIEIQAIDGVAFRCLLRPQIRPGVLVTLDSDAVQGVYRVEAARYEGDTAGGPFEVQAEAYQLPGAVSVPR